MKINEILPKVKANLSNERYEHTLRVIQTAKKLAKIHGINVEKVELASALHDYAKCEDKLTLKQYIIDNNLDSDLLNYHHELWHGPVAAHFTEYTIGIRDKEVINAIKYHTTGRAHMGLVELTVFIADFIEPARQIPGIESVRHAAREDLNEAALLELKGTITHLVSKNATIYPGTIEAYNDLINLKGDR